MRAVPVSWRWSSVAAFLLVLLLGRFSLAAEVVAAGVPGLGHIVKARRGGDGVIHVLADGPGGPRYARSSDGGVTFGPPMVVVVASDLPAGLEFAGEDLAVGPDGRVHVALSSNGWKLKRPQEEWGFYYAQLPAGGEAFTPLRNLNRKPSEGFALAAGTNGLVVASFLSGKLHTMVSEDAGKSFGPFAELNPAWNPCDCCTTALAFGSDGRTALLYREETDNLRDPHLALWEATRGTTLSRTRLGEGHWRLAGCPMTYFVLEPVPTGYLAAWPTEGQVRWARLDLAGKLLPPGEIAAPGTTGMRQHLVILESTGGTVLVAWQEREQVRWQRYDRRGQPIGVPGAAASTGKGVAGVPLTGDRFRLFP